jgi:hypothetical protein
VIPGAQNMPSWPTACSTKGPRLESNATQAERTGILPAHEGSGHGHNPACESALS